MYAGNVFGLRRQRDEHLRIELRIPQWVRVEILHDADDLVDRVANPDPVANCILAVPQLARQRLVDDGYTTGIVVREGAAGAHLHAERREEIRADRSALGCHPRNRSSR